MAGFTPIAYTDEILGFTLAVYHKDLDDEKGPIRLRAKSGRYIPPYIFDFFESVSGGGVK